MPKLEGFFGLTCVCSLDLVGKLNKPMIGTKISKALCEASRFAVTNTSFVDEEECIILGQVAEDVVGSIVLATSDDCTIKSLKFRPLEEYNKIYLLDCYWDDLGYGEGKYKDIYYRRGGERTGVAKRIKLADIKGAMDKLSEAVIKELSVFV